MSRKKNEVEVLARGVCVADGQLLVCHTKGAETTYLPGGHVDFGESVKEALVREIDEELGLSGSAGRFLGACDHSFEQDDGPHCEVNLVFELRVEGVDPETSPVSQEDYIEFMWLDLDSVEQSDLEPRSLRSALPQWISASGTVDRWVSAVL